MVRQAFYPLYERAVQTPEVHADFFAQVHRELADGREARSLREDFSGTFLVSCAWVKGTGDRTALAVDLDPECLKYGKNHHLRKLKPAERRRVRTLLADVATVTAPVDVAAACNFSFFCLTEWDHLVRYFECAKRSLKKGGMLVLEVGGGPGMTQKITETRRLRLADGTRFTYYWDQKSFDPVSHLGRFAIHFKTADGEMHRDVFAYRWRLWSIPELRAALKQAGFASSHIYWEERTEDNKLTGEYVLSSRGENDHSWVSYVVGVR
ncbi:MAG TPA: class I SAM-dependent methyltransferase [Bdellovibrionota bacterium]|jgi:SAM-dependent methyltransferase|nr:class I SAM-dependent methyltransferase [Bdellovibrionota bacterium]